MSPEKPVAPPNKPEIVPYASLEVKKWRAAGWRRQDEMRLGVSSLLRIPAMQKILDKAWKEIRVGAGETKGFVHATAKRKDENGILPPTLYYSPEVHKRYLIAVRSYLPTLGWEVSEEVRDSILEHIQKVVGRGG